MIATHRWTWWLPALFLLGLSPWLTTWDLEIARYFYNPETKQFTHSTFTYFIYNHGQTPCWIVSAGSLIAAVVLIRRNVKQWLLRPCLVLCLTGIIGPGLLVNAVFKPGWDRPRPRQVIEFGGYQQFYPFYQPQWEDPEEESKSFPSGHTSTGFYFLVLCTLGWRHNNRKLIWIGIITSAALGGALGYSRIAHGGHFLSDTLYAGLLMWWTILALDWAVYDKWTGRISDRFTRNKT